MDVSIIVAIISSTALIIVAVIAFIREMRLKKFELVSKVQSRINKDVKLKSDILEKLIDFSTFNAIRDSVDRIFSKTKASKFYIFMALNGKTDFNIISLVFEQNDTTKYRVNAIIRFKQIGIDSEFRHLIKETELNGPILLDVDTMDPQLLKDIYLSSDVTHSMVRHLYRGKIDDDNDVVIFSTLSTQKPNTYTEKELAIVNAEYEGTIVQSIKEYLTFI